MPLLCFDNLKFSYEIPIFIEDMVPQAVFSDKY